MYDEVEILSKATESPCVLGMLRPCFIFWFWAIPVSTFCILTTNKLKCKEQCDTCSAEAKCAKDCTYCTDGYFGDECERKCPAQCHKRMCVLLPTGEGIKCTHGCERGWRGLTCRRPCRYQCLECDRLSGKCVGPYCRDGYYGQLCNKVCADNCSRCNKTDGVCITDVPYTSSTFRNINNDPKDQENNRVQKDKNDTTLLTEPEKFYRTSSLTYIISTTGVLAVLVLVVVPCLLFTSKPKCGRNVWKVKGDCVSWTATCMKTPREPYHIYDEINESGVTYSGPGYITAI